MTTQNTTELLCKFVNQRPGLEYANYGDITSYRAEMREITKDRNDFFELLSLAQRRVENFDAKLSEYLTATNGRLSLKNGKLDYCTGQYFPTEYRPAANRILSNLIWASYRDETETNSPNPIYKDGHAIRKAIDRNLSRRVVKHYFN